jgi:hypothetical protein
MHSVCSTSMFDRPYGCCPMPSKAFGDLPHRVLAGHCRLSLYPTSSASNCTPWFQKGGTRPRIHGYRSGEKSIAFLDCHQVRRSISMWIRKQTNPSTSAVKARDPGELLGAQGTCVCWSRNTWLEPQLRALRKNEKLLRVQTRRRQASVALACL